MHLKQIDLVGFKSFAARTSFVFEPGVTVLCGPNGSGKSNVSDAVRWALGEQNARAIRGRKSEDVIFVGSQGRQPLGLAEVSLTLDNADGRIPLEFGEVRVTRRVYRSGEAEYLVNGTRTRLRDIHAWLLHAALDPDAYVVVGQGSVDELILQRPEERRAVLENAADTRRHQARLAETRSRIAATEENLVRCRAVIAELEPHVSRLRTQSEKADRYRAVRVELADVAARWFRHSLRGAQNELQSARRDAERARAKLDETDSEIAEAELQLSRTAAGLHELESALAADEDRARALRDDLAARTRDVAIAEERLASSQRAAASVSQDLEAARSRVSQLDDEIGEIQAAVAREAGALAEAQAALDEASREEQRLRAAAGELRSELQALDTKLTAAREAVSGAQRSLAEWRDRAARAQRDLDELGKTVGQREQDLTTAQTESQSRSEAAAEAQGRLEALRREWDTLQQEREKASAAVSTLRRERHEADGELQRLAIEQRGLEDLLATDRSGVGSAARGREGYAGLVAGLFSTPDRLVTAITAALEHRAQTLVFQRTDQARGLLNEVAQTAKSRVGAVSVTPPGGNHETTLIVAALEGLPYLGIAADLVGCEPPYASLKSRLLGDTVVVETGRAADAVTARLWSAGTLPSWQVVTLDGEVTRSNGEWRTGHDRGAERLVGVRAALDEVSARLVTARNAAEAIAQRMSEAETADAERARQAQAIQPAVRAAEQADRQAALAAQAAATRTDRLTRELSEVRSATPRLHQTLERAAREQASQAEALAVAEANHARQLAARGELDARVRSAGASWEDARHQVTELRAQHAAQRSALEARRALGDRLARTRTEAERAIAEIDRRAAAEREQAARLVQEIAAARTGLETCRAELEPVERRVGEARARRSQIASGRLEMEQRTTQIRAVSRAQRTVVEAAAIEASRAGDRLERMHREAREWCEEAGLDLDEGGEPTALPLLFQPGADDDREAAVAEFDPDAARRRMNALRRELRAIGPVNEDTLRELAELGERHQFLVEQTSDLDQTLAELRTTMEELEVMMRGAFDNAFGAVNGFFAEYFARLFGGGHAELILTRPDDVLTTGVDIVARPPGKRLQPLVSLSGGERALTMVALIFALLKTNPAPFCVLDEVDAALDESNVRRFTGMLEELSDRTQFIVVTHNRATMEIAKFLYGISMDTNGVSSVVSLKLPAESSAV